LLSVFTVVVGDFSRKARLKTHLRPLTRDAVSFTWKECNLSIAQGRKTGFNSLIRLIATSKLFMRNFLQTKSELFFDLNQKKRIFGLIGCQARSGFSAGWPDEKLNEKTLQLRYTKINNFFQALAKRCGQNG